VAIFEELQRRHADLPAGVRRYVRATDPGVARAAWRAARGDLPSGRSPAPV
jgi:hypothetical protein